MKHAKRLFGILLALTLALACALPAFAETGATTNVTMGNRLDANSKYYAYQLFTARFVRMDNIDGEDVDVYEYHLNPKFADAIKAGILAVNKESTLEVSADNEEAVLEYLKKLSVDGERNGDIRTFADGVYKYITDHADSFQPVSGDPSVVESTGDTFEGLAGGYYLIAEEVSANTDSAVTSLVMLDTAGKEDITVKTKEEAPESYKKVKDINDTTDDTTGDWHDSADWDIGDHVDFQLTGILPADYDDPHYKTYYLAFHDEECEGLTFDGEGTVKVFVDIDGAGDAEPVSVEEGYTVKYDPANKQTDGCTFEIVFEDVKTAIPEAKPGSIITVEYTSTLNEKAKIDFDGNPNTMYMEFSNNPYVDGDGDDKPDTGHTPKDTVIVFTFEADIEKVDGNGNPLAGAGFTLFKKIKGEDFEGKTETAYSAENKDGNWIAAEEGYIWKKIGKEIAGVTTFEFRGLDDGKYMLEETTVPLGYNKADNIYFAVEATHEELADDPRLLTLKVTQYENENFTGDPVSTWTNEARIDTTNPQAEKHDITGKFGTKVMNLTGAELPSTGGMGTTLFYIVGGVLVAAAVILLVTKKRVNSNDK